MDNLAAYRAGDGLSVASDSVYLGQIADFFFSPNRWNVALSRVRTKVIVVGSKYLAQALPAYGEVAHSLWHALLLAHPVAIEFSASTGLE